MPYTGLVAAGEGPGVLLVRPAGGRATFRGIRAMPCTIAHSNTL